MNKSSKHSKGKAIARFLAAIAMVGTFALSTDVAMGFLSNMQAYLHIQPAQSANAVASSNGASVLASQ